MNIPKITNEEQLLNACDRALRLVPVDYPPTLPPNQDLLGAEDWYPFEHEAWAIGEQVRQAFVRNRAFKKNLKILRRVLDVSTCRNLRRGRQSFVMALGFVAAAGFAEELVPFLNDSDVDGHVLYTLLKMRAPGLTAKVSPLLQADKTWIRRLAKRYLERYPK